MSMIFFICLSVVAVVDNAEDADVADPVVVV